MDHVIILAGYEDREGPENYAATFRGTLTECQAQQGHDGCTSPIQKSDFDAIFEEKKKLENGAGVDDGAIYRLRPRIPAALREGHVLSTVPERKSRRKKAGVSKSSTEGAVLLLPLLMAGCTMFQSTKVIENRFSARSAVSSVDPLVRLAVTSAPVPPAAAGDGGIRITELSDQGQAALIAATAGKPPTKLAPAKSGGDTSLVVANTLARRIVVAVRPQGFLTPGDRVDAIRVALSVNPAEASRWRITGWSQATNGQEVIDIGKLTDTASSKISGTTGIAAVNFLPEASVSAEASRTQAREMQLKDTTDFDAAVDNSGNAWLDETAGWRVNLAHNLGIDVTLTAPAATLDPQPYFAASGLWADAKAGLPAQPKPPSEVQVRTVTRYLPQTDERAVCGVAALTYRIRRITNAEGRATFSESDDVVTYDVLKSTTGFLLAPPPYVPLYALDTAGKRLSFWNAVSKQSGMRFASLEDAISFRDWMIRSLPKGGAIANGTVSLADANGLPRAMTASEIAGLLPMVANATEHRTAQEEEARICPDPA